MNLNQILILTLSLIVFVGCSFSHKPPKKPYSAYPLAPRPDYADRQNWSSLPDKDDFADLNPEGVSPEAQATAAADVFFIHPTTFPGGLAWNADAGDRELNAKTDERAVKHQASIFNHSCRVFVPRYRQMALGGFFTEDTASKEQALALAYNDIRRAFRYYLEHYNQGRPIVIAGHSQGALHGIQLLKDYFDGQPLQNQLVAAYLLGWPLPEGSYESIPVCDSPEQNGCLVSWCSWKKGFVPKSIDTYYKDAIVVNPLTWRANNSFAPDSLHDGFLTGNFKNIKANSLDTQAHKGILWVSNPFPVLGAAVKNYHVGDFNLFWVDIRKNVARRVANFNQR